MTTTIYYFSGSGNSLQLARDLADKLGGATLVSIPDAMDGAIDTTRERIGFVVPVYMWGLPKIVMEFLARFPHCPDTYFFAVANCGSSIGRTIMQLRKLLRTNGNRLHAAFKMVLPGNYTPLYGAKKEAVQQKLFRKAAVAVERAAEAIQSGRTVRLIPSPFSCLLSLFLHGSAMKKIRSFDEKFEVEEACTGCGICAKVCPVGNIRMEERRPVWQHHCEHCLACLHWCPEGVIQYGRSTRGRSRYRNPRVTVQEMMRR